MAQSVLFFSGMQAVAAMGGVAVEVVRVVVTPVEVREVVTASEKRADCSS